MLLENKNPFQHTHLNLPKLQILKMTLTVWQVIPFLKLNLRMNVPKPQLGDSILLPDSIMTPVSSSNFSLFFESTLDPVPIYHEIELPIFYDHYIELD